MSTERFTESRADQYRIMRYSSADRYQIFEGIYRAGPLASFSRQHWGFGYTREQSTLDNVRTVKVEPLFDYTLLEKGPRGEKIVQFDGMAPIIEDEGDSRFYGDTCVLEYRRRTDGMVLENNDTMEIPVALTRFLHPNLKFDVVTTKTFLSMLCRFIENEHRFYRFDVERIGNTIFIQDLPYGDARPFKTYIQGALDILTGRANMDYRQLSTFYFGNKRFLLRHTVDLAEYRSHPAQPYWKREIAQRFAEKCAEQDSRFLHSNEQDPFFPAFQEMLPSFRRLGTCLDAPDPIHHIHGTTVAIRGPLSCRAMDFKFDSFTTTGRIGGRGLIRRIHSLCMNDYLQMHAGFQNVQLKWPNMLFSGANRLISVLHVRGVIDHRPKSFTFEDIAPTGYFRNYKHTLIRASALCNQIVDYIQRRCGPDDNKLALIWVNDKESPRDVNDGQHLVLYRRQRAQGSEGRTFVSPQVRESLLQDAVEYWR